MKAAWQNVVNDIANLQINLFGEHGKQNQPASKAAIRRARVGAMDVIHQLKELRVVLAEMAKEPK
jgi:hypothetical protein